MIKNAVINFLIWLNTPRCLEIPTFSESKDAELYDDLNERIKVLETRKNLIFQQIEEFVVKDFVQRYGYIPSQQYISAESQKHYNGCKEIGYIDEFNLTPKMREAL